MPFPGAFPLSALGLLALTQPLHAASRPTASSQSVTTYEDTSEAITLVGSDSSGAALTYTIDTLTPRTRGSVLCLASACTYAPSPNFAGTDRFNFKVSNGTVSSAWASVTVTVNAVNDLPTANGQSLTATEDLPRTVVLTGSDLETPGSLLTYQVVTSPRRGTASVAGALLTYTPEPDYSGPDELTVRCFDGSAYSAPATVSVNVTGVADRPTAADHEVYVGEDGVVTFPLPASDADGDVLTPLFGGVQRTGDHYTTISEAHGTFTVSGTVVTYTPAPDYHGEDSFTYTVTDGTLSAAGFSTVTIHVSPVNDPPTAQDHWVRAANGTPAHVVLSGSDVDGDALSWSIVGAPRFGSATIWNGNRLVYRPSSGAVRGTDAVTWRVGDGTSWSETRTLVVDLVPGIAPFPLDELAVETSLPTWTTTDGNVVMELATAIPECQRTYSHQPRIPASLDGVPIGEAAVVATHYDTLTCGYDDYLAEYSAIYIVTSDGTPGGFEARLLDVGDNVEAAGTYLDDGSLLFTRTGGTELGGGLLRFTPGSPGSDTHITTTTMNGLGAVSDASPLYDDESGVTLLMTVAVPETCGDADDNDCGVVATMDVAGNLLDLVDEADGHHAWGSAGCVSFGGEPYCGFGAGSDASGPDWLDGNACAVGRVSGLPLPPSSDGVVGVDLALADTLDMGSEGCTQVGSLASSIINGGIVSDGEWLYVAALGSDATDDYARVYQLDAELAVQQVFEIPAEFTHSFTNGFHNSLLVGANGHVYLTGTIDEVGTVQYAVVDLDPATGEVALIGMEVVSHDNAFGTGHLYVDAAGDEVIVHAVGNVGVVTRLSDGALLDAFQLGDSDGAYAAAPLLIEDGDGDPDALVFVSTDNVVTVVPNSGLYDDLDAPWPGPRGGGAMRATLD